MEERHLEILMTDSFPYAATECNLPRIQRAFAKANDIFLSAFQLEASLKNYYLGIALKIMTFY